MPEPRRSRPVSKLHVVVQPSRDVTMEALCLMADSITERLEWLDVSCLQGL